MFISVLDFTGLGQLAQKFTLMIYTDGILVSLVYCFSLLRQESTYMRRLTTGIRSEKCVVRRFRRYANVIECTYTGLDSIAYYTLSLCIAYCS